MGKWTFENREVWVNFTKVGSNTLMRFLLHAKSLAFSQLGLIHLTVISALIVQACQSIWLCWPMLWSGRLMAFANFVVLRTQLSA